MRPVTLRFRRHPSPVARRLCAALVVLLLAAGIVAPPARAATDIVTTCASSGPGSLPDVLASAAANDTLTFAQDCTGANAITLSATLTPTTSITIDATGHAVTISGGGSVRLFNVNSGITLGLRDLTLVNGNGNTMGGAVANFGGTLNVATSTFSGNIAFNGGGSGGAIYSTGLLNVVGSVFSGNTVAYAGGAIDNNSSTATVVNSTFSGNTVIHSGHGGAISNDGSFSTINVIGSTFSGNTVLNAGLGGGAISAGVGGTLRLALSVVAGNTSPGASGADIYGPVTDGGGNVIGNTGGTGGFTNPSDRLNVPALLAPLGNYGGPVQTFALLPGSPALDIAACPTDPTTGTTLATDARGVPRPQGANCDAGAVESLGFTLANIIGTPQTAGPGTAFALSPGLTVNSATGEPVTGGLVTFAITAGTGGSSGIFGSAPACALLAPTVAVCSVGALGSVTAPPVTANGATGAFTVTASARGAASGMYTLTVALMPNATPQPAPTHMMPGMPGVAPPTHVPSAGIGAGTPTPLPQPARH